MISGKVVPMMCGSKIKNKLQTMLDMVMEILKKNPLDVESIEGQI